MLKSREVRAPHEIIYNVAGRQDMLPAATRQYTKADWPASARYKADNDRRMLASFFKYCPGKHGNRSLLESEDMYHAMCGPEDGRRRMAIDRSGRPEHELEEDEPSYGPNWPVQEIAKGAWNRGKSMEPQQSESATLGGSLTARTARSPDLPLRWPSNQIGVGGEEGSTSARSASSRPAFRSPNGLCDFAGLNGLGIWRSAAAGAPVIKSDDRAKAQNRAKTPNARRPQSSEPSKASPMSATGWAFRSPNPAHPGLATYRANSPPPRRTSSSPMSARDKGPNSTQSRPALDTTREKGAEFPQTPQAKVKEETWKQALRLGEKGSFDARSPGSVAGSLNKGVWSQPSAALQFGSPGTAVFAL